MKRYTTFVFIGSMIGHLKRLSLRCRVLLLEVIRCVLSQAEKLPVKAQADLIERLAKLHASGAGFSEREANTYLEELYEGRKFWREL